MFEDASIYANIRLEVDSNQLMMYFERQRLSVILRRVTDECALLK